MIAIDFGIGVIMICLVLIIFDCMKREYIIVKQRSQMNKAKLNNLVDELEIQSCGQSHS